VRAALARRACTGQALGWAPQAIATWQTGSVGLTVPDHTALSRRGRGFADRQPRAARHDGPIHLVLDSTRLQLFGQGEWDAGKHGRTRRHWRKLHLAVGAGTGEITAHVLTDGTADDAVQAPALLRQVEGRIASVTADGAYDSEPIYRAAAARQHGRRRTWSSRRVRPRCRVRTIPMPRARVTATPVHRREGPDGLAEGDGIRPP